MGRVDNIQGIACDRCPTKLLMDHFDLHKGLPEGWLYLATVEAKAIFLCPECVAAVRAVLAPPTNGKVSVIEAINSRRG